jgi:hypothetical protein
MKEQSLARFLANFSLGLGLAELLAPRHVARLAGVSPRHARTIQALGLREIGSGLGLMQGKPAWFLWARVAGDAMDLGLLAAAARSPGSNPRRVNGALLAVAGVTVLDVAASLLCSRSHSEPGWRIAEPETYRGAIAREEPQAARAACDAAMTEHASGHLRETAEQEALPLLEPREA